jgi:hypothetical protein
MTERLVLTYGAGAACLSALVFALCAMGLARTPVLVAAAVLVALGFALRPVRPGKFEAARLSRSWLLFFGLIAVPFAALYLVNAAAPEISPDGSVYHLGLVRRYLNHHGFYRLTTSLYANLTQGTDMLFLVGYAVGQHSAAALVHLTFLFALPAAMIAYSRRFGFGTAGVIGALLVFVAPVVGIDGSSAYVDVALSFAGFACFYALEIWGEGRRAVGLLVVAGLLAGFCFATKYTGAVAIVYAVAYVAWRGRSWRSVGAMVLPALAIALPWLAKNWIIVDNPLSPFFNRLFPNPYIHISFEDEYRQALRHFNGATIGWATPLELTVRGGLLQGTLGPTFLIAPLGLAALRDPRGRRILAAAALFAAPWFANIGTRFLIPALPFIALAMAIPLARWPKAAVAVAAANAILCWPAVLNTYCAPYAWRLSRFPVAAALRVTPKRQFIETYAPEVRFADLIQDHVPPDGVVYTAQPVMESYTDRTILLDYAAALNERIRDTLAAAIRPAMQPSERVVFRFEAQDARGFRLIATGSADNWTIHEIEPPAARVSASPNPWDAQLAGDHLLATSWRAWQPVRPGASLEADLARTLRIDSVSLRTRPGDPSPALQLALRAPSGEWKAVASRVGVERGLATPGLRSEAMREIRRCGVTHLLIHDQEPLGPDFRAHLAEWQVRFIASAEPVRLYEILPAKMIDTSREVRNNTR